MLLLLEANAVCVRSGRTRDEWCGDRWGCGGLGGLWGGGVGMYTVNRLYVIKRRVVPALP